MPGARVGAPWYESIGFEKLGLESIGLILGRLVEDKAGF